MGGIMDKICSFFGHRQIMNTEWLRKRVTFLVERLIVEQGYAIFLFGGFGEFDELCYNIVSHLKEKYPKLQRIYCVHDEKYLLERKHPVYLRTTDYEEFIYLPLSFDYWYTRIYYRNCEMIERSDYIIFYTENRKNSGANKALEYAKRHKKEYANLFYERNDNHRD